MRRTTILPAAIAATLAAAAPAAAGPVEIARGADCGYAYVTLTDPPRGPKIRVTLGGPGGPVLADGHAATDRTIGAIYEVPAGKHHVYVDARWDGGQVRFKVHVDCTPPAPPALPAPVVPAAPAQPAQPTPNTTKKPKAAKKPKKAKKAKSRKPARKAPKRTARERRNDRRGTARGRTPRTLG